MQVKSLSKPVKTKEKMKLGVSALLQLPQQP